MQSMAEKMALQSTIKTQIRNDAESPISPCRIVQRPRLREFAQAKACGSAVLLSCVLGSIVLCGCGTDLPELLQQSALSAGRTFLDGLLTDLANALAEPDTGGAGDSTDDGTADDSGDEGDEPGMDDGTGADGDMDDTGSGLANLTGESVVGESLYIINGCASCHCADASGGCALSAPSVVGDSATSLDESLRGEASHPIKVDLSDQEIVDISAYLDSLATNGG